MDSIPCQVDNHHKKGIYAVLCVIGFIAPYYFFVRFVAEHGLDFSMFVRQVFATPAHLSLPLT
jgi:hypothetical protein